jgi:hypothetical protein
MQLFPYNVLQCWPSWISEKTRFYIPDIQNAWCLNDHCNKNHIQVKYWGPPKWQFCKVWFNLVKCLLETRSPTKKLGSKWIENWWEYLTGPDGLNMTMPACILQNKLSFHQIRDTARRDIEAFHIAPWYSWNIAKVGAKHQSINQSEHI